MPSNSSTVMTPLFSVAVLVRFARRKMSVAWRAAVSFGDDAGAFQRPACTQATIGRGDEYQVAADGAWFRRDQPLPERGIQAVAERGHREQWCCIELPGQQHPARAAGQHHAVGRAGAGALADPQARGVDAPALGKGLPAQQRLHARQPLARDPPVGKRRTTQDQGIDVAVEHHRSDPVVAQPRPRLEMSRAGHGRYAGDMQQRRPHRQLCLLHARMRAPFSADAIEVDRCAQRCAVGLHPRAHADAHAIAEARSQRTSPACAASWRIARRGAARAARGIAATAGAPPVDLASDDMKKLKETLERGLTDEQVAQYDSKIEQTIGTSINKAAFAQVTGANN